MSMQVWLEQRSVKLLQDINAVPFTDEHDARVLMLLRKALQESSTELVRRAVEKSVSDIISEDAMGTPGKY